MEDRLDGYRKALQEVSETYSSAITEYRRDFDIYVSNHLDNATKQAIIDSGRPPIVINVGKKAVDLFVGFQQQNRSDIKYFGVQNADEQVAEIYTQLAKWHMHEMKGHYKVSKAFQNSCICGIGWLYVDLIDDWTMFSKKIRMRSLSPMAVAPDPKFAEGDIDNARYILYYSRVSKDDLLATPQYQKARRDIEAASLRSTESHSVFVTEAEDAQRTHYGEFVDVVEMWERKMVAKQCIVDYETKDVKTLETAQDKRDAKAAVAMDSGRFDIITISAPEVTLLTVMNDEVIIYDGPNPLQVNYYPFIPILSTYIDSYPDWKYKCQGVLRVMRDLILERSKRRQQISAAYLEMPLSGFFYKEGSIESLSDFTRSTGAGRLIKYRGERPTPIPPPQIQGAVSQLETLFAQDIREIGPTHDMLGLMQESREAGITQQMRTRQGMTASQDIYENLSAAMIQLGRVLLGYFNLLPEEKVRNILRSEQDLPMGWEEMKSLGGYDCTVDEIVESPAFRSMVFAQLMAALEKGFDIPPDMLIEWSELPFSAKQQLREHAQKIEEEEMAAQQPPPQPGNDLTNIPPDGMIPQQ